MTDKLYCPRGYGQDSPFHSPFNGEMRWQEDGTCSYCGSLNPDTFMARLEAGDVTLTPTDKNYKVYVDNDGGELFKQTYRDCPRDEKYQKACDCPSEMPEDCKAWVTKDVSRTKFYFQHLSDTQQARFIELYNEKKINLKYPGYFYRVPFFCQTAEPKSA